MTDVAALREFRQRLHDRAYDLHSHGRTEAAQAVWTVVEELDGFIDTIAQED